MPNIPEHYVYLIPQRDEQNNVSWTWVYKGKSGPASSFPAIEAKKGSGKHDIYFTILNLDQQQIKFDGYNGPDTSKAISIAVKQPSAPQKPTSGITSSGQIKNITFGEDGAQILLDNANSKKIELVYSLNFVDAANNNQPVTSIDPDIRNGGGGGGFDWLMESAEVLITGAVVGALVGLALARWGLGWRKA